MEKSISLYPIQETVTSLPKASVVASSNDTASMNLKPERNGRKHTPSGTKAADGHSSSYSLLAGEQVLYQNPSHSCMEHNSFEVTEMKKLNEKTVPETAPLAAGTPAASRSGFLETHADVLPDYSSKSALGIVSEVHDSRVQDLLVQVIEYSKEHPGLVKNIRLRERTLGALMPDNGDKALDELEKHGSSQVQVLRNVCDGNVIAIIGKESIIDFNVADSEQ